jgi:hypothetical protein
VCDYFGVVIAWHSVYECCDILWSSSSVISMFDSNLNSESVTDSPDEILEIHHELFPLG